MSLTKCLKNITKPPVWGSQGPYKDCRAAADDQKYNALTLHNVAF
jgi:hypothetical protein